MRRPKRNTRKSKRNKRMKRETPEYRVSLRGNLLFQSIRERERIQQRHDFTRALALKGTPYKEIKHRMWLGECYAT